MLPLPRVLLGLLCLLAWLRPAAGVAQSLPTRPLTREDGSPNILAQCLGQDEWGRLWVGMETGLYGYNGQAVREHRGREAGLELDVFALAPVVGRPAMWLGQTVAGLAVFEGGRRARPVRVPGLRRPSLVLSLASGPGEVWMGTANQGLWHLRFGGGRPDTLVQHWPTVAGRSADSVGYIGPGLWGQQWACTPHGLLVFDRRGGQPLPAAQAALPAALAGPVNGFCRVSDSVAWVGTRTGLLRVSAPQADQSWHLRRYTTADGLCENNIRRVVQDRQGRVWANASNGLSLSAAGAGADGRFTCSAQPAHIYTNRRDLLVDQEGNVWVADARGVTQFLANQRFSQFTQAEGLAQNIVFAIAQPRPDELWVGSTGGLDVLPLTATGTRPPLRHLAPPLPAGKPTLPVSTLLTDHRGQVWVGTFSDGLRRYDLRTGHWENLNARLPLPAHSGIVSLEEDKRGQVWIAAYRQGLVVYDPVTDTYRRYRAGERGLPAEETDLRPLHRDRAGRLWLGSSHSGLLAVDTEHDAFRQVSGLPTGTGVLVFGEDQRGGLWLSSGTTELLRYEPATGQFQHLGSRPGLDICGIGFLQGDSAGQLWVGTCHGVSALNISTGKARAYGLAEGFGSEVDYQAAWRSPDGRQWMGTPDGLLLYDPRYHPQADAVPTAHLTGLRVGPRDTALAPGLRLPYALNSVSLDYLSVSLARPGRVRYRYRLRGYHAEWVAPTTSASATYASLPPGSYTFEVQASTNGEQWSPQPAAFSFTIEAPWWRRWWAYGLYAATGALALLALRRRLRQRAHEQLARELERQSLSYLQELDRVKTDFFTNVSHELRTPLTLIMGPAELVADTSTDPASRQQGGLVLTQARRLLALINQLLDLSKLDAGALRLHPTDGDVARLARQLVASFESLAQRQQLSLRLDAPAGPVPLVFDAAKLEEVLTNLLANALRFTPAGGTIMLRVRELAPAAVLPAGGVELAVDDTGPGIAAEELPHLFDRFYQANNQAATADRQGTGIGLALVRELVQLHGGEVTVQSGAGQGASFVVRLPRGRLQPAADTAGAVALPAAGAGTLLPAPHAAPAPPASPADPDPDAAQVLVVEDSEEVRAFIAEALAGAGYRLLLAPDGAAGLALARAEVPDLVVSDVMMPGLDGYQLCAALQADAATSHIPVVLLTARATADDRLQGLETGAQAYVPKPFRPRELQAQVRSLLHLSEQNRARFAGPAAPDSPAPAAPASPPPAPAATLAQHRAAVAALPSLDQAFLHKLEAAVLARLGDGGFGVDQLGDELHLSRTQLHRKVKALTGQAPGEYLRQTRLLRALALLQARAAPVAEVAYLVGYNSPANFSTAFSRQFGYPPSAVAPASE